jgi:putative peptidoglycan lipid II flippase
MSPPVCGAASEGVNLRRLAGDSHIVAAGILASRISGFARISVTAAVLGPTYFANLFQTAAVLPSTFYSVLMGMLTSALLVPPLVRRANQEGTDGVQRFANAALGVMALLLLAVGILAVALTPFLLQLVLPAREGGQEKPLALGLPLLLMLMPQTVLYGVAGVAAAVQQAQGRFGISSAASAVENLGCVVLMGLSALLFGMGADFKSITMPHLVLLGFGTTAAVALHAAVQWWGAWRLGVSLRPSFDWSDPEISYMLRRGSSSLAFTGQYWAAFLLPLLVAGSVPGGVAAFYMANGFCSLPSGLVARPLSAAQLPPLARAYHNEDRASFRAIYLAAQRLTLFVAVPASLVIAAVPETVARALAFGKMGSPSAIYLVSLCIGGMALGTVGDAMQTVSFPACYARHDTRSPVVAMAIRLSIAGIGTAAAWYAVVGPQRLWIIGGFAAAANLAAATYLHLALTRTPGKLNAGLSGLGEMILVSAAAVAPAYLMASWFGNPFAGFTYHVVVAMAALSVSVVTYGLLHFLRGSQELSLILPFIGRTPLARGQPTWRKE